MNIKKLAFPILATLSGCFGYGKIVTKTDSTMKPQKSIYEIKMLSIEGEEIDFSKYKGKKILIINVASKCGFTPQYENLQALHDELGDKVVLIGVPANNFGKQEPGTLKEIKEFCNRNYGVSFLMTEKSEVVGENKCELYQWLSNKDQNGWNTQEPTWNFCKYLINEQGEIVKFYASSVDPLKEIKDDILK